MIMKRACLVALGGLVAFAAATSIRSFESVPLESVSETTANVSIGDLNGDGHLACLRLGPESAATILTGDMDGDGAIDLIVACRDECQSVVYFNDGKGNFTRKQPFGPAGSSTRVMAIADFHGDGRLDIAACHE